MYGSRDGDQQSEEKTADDVEQLLWLMVSLCERFKDWRGGQSE